MDYFKLHYIEIRQNIGSFYLTKMTPKQLHAIANTDLSRYKDAEEGIQREVSKSRTKAIAEYIENSEATFPNTIIISVSINPESDNPEYVIKNDSELLIKNEDGVANILDGQHRLSGFSDEVEDFELPVAIFFDLSIAQQAMIFAKINSTQVKVSLDLVYELFDITDKRSEQKTAYTIVKELNTEKTSPWFHKIKTLSDRSGDMAQGSFSKYIDKELISRGKILRNLYDEERDKDLSKILSNYFASVKKNFPVEWQNENKKFILTKTTGFVGFMLFFKDLITIARKSKKALTFEFFDSKVSISVKNFEPLDSKQFESGAKGQNKIREILRGSLSNEEKELIGIK